MTDIHRLLNAWRQLDPELRDLLGAVGDWRQQQRVEQAVDELQRLPHPAPEALSLLAALRSRLPRPAGLSALYPTPQRDIRDVIDQETVTLHDVRWVARGVGGSVEAAESFMTNPLAQFGGLTPEQLVAQGRGKEVVGILLNIAGV